MQKTIVVFIMGVVSLIGMSQTNKEIPIRTSDENNQTIDVLLARIDSLLVVNNELLDRIDINSSLKKRYKLYRTENIYTLLQLDTQTGKIEQIQWSLESDKEGSFSIL